MISSPPPVPWKVRLDKAPTPWDAVFEFLTLIALLYVSEKINYQGRDHSGKAHLRPFLKNRVLRKGIRWISATPLVTHATLLGAAPLGIQNLKVQGNRWSIQNFHASLNDSHTQSLTNISAKQLLAGFLRFYYLYLAWETLWGSFAAFIKITLKQISRTNLTCSPRRKNWILQYLLHEVLCPLNDKIDVIDLEATLEVLQELLEQVHFQIAGLHFHWVKGQAPELIHILHSHAGFDRKQPEVNFKIENVTIWL